MKTPQNTKVVSGMRPTGQLHLGHYHGVLKNWLKLQEQYECFFFVADWHGLTTEYANPGLIREMRHEVLADWLAVGLDPKRSTLFIQSDVKEHAELHLLLSMITPVGWLERVPSFKDVQQEQSSKDLSTYGFLGYPLLQAADIALYDGTTVPVGVDQVPHIEFAREVIRRFNHLYGKTLVEPQPLLTAAPKLLGTDRRKMSKSFNNGLYLADSSEAITKKIMPAITDPARKRREDPGNPDICLIYDYHKLHSDMATIQRVDQECRTAKIGCVDCKKLMLAQMLPTLEPIRQRRETWLRDPAALDQIAEQGRQKAEKVARATLTRVRQAMKLE